MFRNCRLSVLEKPKGSFSNTGAIYGAQTMGRLQGRQISCEGDPIRNVNKELGGRPYLTQRP